VATIGHFVILLNFLNFLILKKLYTCQVNIMICDSVTAICQASVTVTCQASITTTCQVSIIVTC